MEEFEKWYNELPMREDAEDFTISTYKKYRKGWVAALKWMLNNTDGSCGVRKCIPMESIRDELKL